MQMTTQVAGGVDDGAAVPNPRAACSAVPSCRSSAPGLLGEDALCCPTRASGYLPCCPLQCSFDGIHCLPDGRSDAAALRLCLSRLHVDGRTHGDMPTAASELLCRYGR